MKKKQQGGTEPEPGPSVIFPDKSRFGGRKILGPVARASVIGLHVVSGLIVGGVLGRLLDTWLETGFWLPVFLVLGFGAGIMNTVRDVKKLLREKDLDAHDSGRHTPEP